MNKSPLAVHQIKLMVQPCPRLCYGGGVGQHADGPLHLGQVTTRHNGGGLVVDTNLIQQKYNPFILYQTPTLNPVGHQSTKLIVLACFKFAMAAFTSLE